MKGGVFPMHEIEAVAVDSHTGERRVLRLQLSESAWSFSDPRGQASATRIPWNSTQLVRGGNRDSLIFFQNPHHLREWDIYIEASKENMRILGQLQSVQSSLHLLRKGQRREWIWSLTLVAVVLGILGALFHYRGAIFGGLGARIPFSLEEQLAQKVFSVQETPDQKGLRLFLQEQFSRIRFQGQEESWNSRFHFALNSESTPNAFATIGGRIFITRGLVGELDRPEQLIGVVAHEMIHVQKRHVMRSLFQALGVFAMFQILLGDVSGVLAVLVDQGGPLLNLQFSRQLEEEADREAFALLVRSQLDPSGLAESLEKLEAYKKRLLQSQPGSEILEKLSKIEMLSSHPETLSRVQKLQALYAPLGSQKWKKLGWNWTDFQKRVKEHY